MLTIVFFFKQDRQSKVEYYPPASFQGYLWENYKTDTYLFCTPFKYLYPFHLCEVRAQTS